MRCLFSVLESPPFYCTPQNPARLRRQTSNVCSPLQSVSFITDTGRNLIVISQCIFPKPDIIIFILTVDTLKLNYYLYQKFQKSILKCNVSKILIVCFSHMLFLHPGLSSQVSSRKHGTSII